MIRLVRSLLLLLGLATLPACAAYEQRAELSSQQVPAPQAAMTATTGPAATGKVTTTRTVVVNFDSNSDEIRAGAMQILYGAAVDLRGAKLTNIRVTGHADGVGRRSYNQKLSERRAAAVAAQLGKLGLRADNVTISGVGESKGAPRRSKDDRRVEIVFELVQDIVATAPLPASSVSADHGAAMTPIIATIATAEHPSPSASITCPTSPAPLRSADKQAIKRFLVLDGTAWLPPPAA